MQSFNLIYYRGETKTLTVTFPDSITPVHCAAWIKRDFEQSAASAEFSISISGHVLTMTLAHDAPLHAGPHFWDLNVDGVFYVGGALDVRETVTNV